MNNIEKAQQLGQQIWLDNLSRQLIQSGELTQKIQTGISGITTNPAIFLKAIQEDNSYQQQLKQLKTHTHSAKARYEQLAISDVQAACDILAAQYRQSNAEKGLVSIEVDPAHAHDPQATIEEARRLHQSIDRDNIMIKIPATQAGIEALQALITDGISINMTLIFSQAQLNNVYQAYEQGLATRTHAQQPNQHIRAVASVFLSRIDSAVDTQLPAPLQGKSAIALAKTAYQHWQTHFKRPEFLAHQARPIQLLWASTGTKNPHYSDVLYLEEVLGAHTINTVPEHTLNAFLDHGQAQERLSQNSEIAQQELTEIANNNIDLNKIGEELQNTGLAQFRTAFSAILSAVE